jgi:putative acyl-CoA dehydrogenase
MVSHTRLDCAIGTAAIMRQALVQAIHNAAGRAAFGKQLIDQTLMQNVLADLAIESEAATTMMLHLARGYDQQREDPAMAAFVRIATAVTKYWICKRAPNMVYECMECLGGMGYVEDTLLPRYYREAPVCSIWEGSGNVISLDLLRAMEREPESAPALVAEIERARGDDRRFDAYTDRLKQELAGRTDHEYRARRLIEMFALALQGSLLLRFAPDYVADAFCASRLAGEGGLAFGTLPAGAAVEKILDRARVPAG